MSSPPACREYSLELSTPANIGFPSIHTYTPPLMLGTVTRPHTHTHVHTDTHIHANTYTYPYLHEHTHWNICMNTSPYASIKPHTPTVTHTLSPPLSLSHTHTQDRTST